jgi:hypothetical protein
MGAYHTNYHNHTTWPYTIHSSPTHSLYQPDYSRPPYVIYTGTYERLWRVIYTYLSIGYARAVNEQGQREPIRPLVDSLILLVFAQIETTLDI